MRPAHRAIPRAHAFIPWLAVVALTGCDQNSIIRVPEAGKASPPVSNSPAPTPGALFEDVAARVGVRFAHTNGADGQFRFVEFSPAGCAFLDYDNDGFLDILLIQS